MVQLRARDHLQFLPFFLSTEIQVSWQKIFTQINFMNPKYLQALLCFSVWSFQYKMKEWNIFHPFLDSSQFLPFFTQHSLCNENNECIFILILLLFFQIYWNKSQFMHTWLIRLIKRWDRWMSELEKNSICR